MQAARNHEFDIVLVWKFESSLISERVKAGMAAAKSRGKRLGRPKTSPYLVAQIEHLAKNTDLSINRIRAKTGNKVSRAAIRQIVKRIRDQRKLN